MQVNPEDRITPQPRSSGSHSRNLVSVAIVVVLCALGYYWLSEPELEPLPAPIPQLEIPEILPSEPLETDPLPEPDTGELSTEQPETMTDADTQETNEPQPAPEPLPPLDDSDRLVLEKTLGVTQGMTIEPLLVKGDIVRQFVVFVDNLAQGELARKVSPMKGPEQKFSVTEIANKTYLDPDGYHRFDLYADLLAKLNGDELYKTFKYLSPLFDEAFGELGYGESKFTGRMTEAIELLLAAPVIEEPIELNAFSVNYKFVDPTLESLPNAQKLMVRMGPENSLKVKEALRKLQAELQH
jgi:hypothetical protein